MNDASIPIFYFIFIPGGTLFKFYFLFASKGVYLSLPTCAYGELLSSDEFQKLICYKLRKSTPN